MDLPKSEPINLRAGDSVSWSRELAEYSAADGWSLKYRLLWVAGEAAIITSTGVGTLHSVTVSAADSATYPVGTATLVGYVERGAGPSLERVTLASTPISILPDLALAANHDGRSANQIALTAARAALASYMAKGQLHVAEYDIAGRVMKFRAAKEIIELIQFYERVVAGEIAATALLSGHSPGRVAVRF